MSQDPRFENPQQMAMRKNDHIRLCAEAHVESHGSLTAGATEDALFGQYHLQPEALPEMAFESVDTRQTFLGRTFSMPLLITGMTGGVERGQEINETLARAASEFNIPMGLGSQKLMVRSPENRALFDVRKSCPNVFLIGNIGAVSFNYGVTLDDVRRLVDSLQLNAFAFHLNALQETIQPEGERNFSGLLKVLEQAVKVLNVPVMVKEVGSGLSVATFRTLQNLGVAAIDVGGRGGTSWSAIEGMRGNAHTQRLGELFRNWGLPTDVSLRACANENKKLQSPVALVATGGIRNGVQVAKAVALGAQMAGVGLPLFRAVVNPAPGLTPLESLRQELRFFQESTAIAMFCSGAGSLGDLPSRLMEGNERA